MPWDLVKLNFGGVVLADGAVRNVSGHREKGPQNASGLLSEV